MNQSLKHGGNECGLFALASVQSLVQGIQPKSCEYIQKQMNQIFNDSVRKKSMILFPYLIKDFQDREIIEIGLSDNFIYTTEENLIYNK